MFRFYCSEWGRTYKWRFSSADDFESVVKAYYEDQIEAFDGDGSGEDVYYFGVTDGYNTKYFKLHHEWWETQLYQSVSITNSYEITEISKAHLDKIQKFIPGDKDWLHLSDIKTKWPPEPATLAQE